MARIGYARVSKDEQDLSLQLDALQGTGCLRIFQEVMSSRLERPELHAALNYLRDGEDTFVVWRMDRAARSLKELIALVEALKVRRIGFHSLTEVIDTGTASGMMVFHLFGAMAEFERAIIRERTMAGLDAARKRGRVGGRPRKVTQVKLRQAMAMMADPQSKASDVAGLIGINRTVLYRYINGDGSLKSLGHTLLYGGMVQADAAAD